MQTESLNTAAPDSPPAQVVMRLAEVAQAAGGALQLTDECKTESGDAAEKAVKGFAMDSREAAAGEVFFALPGARVDGHDFVEEAARRGALAAVVARPVAARLPQIVAADVEAALLAVAAARRARQMIPLCAITGSNGKTTVKEMTAAILREQFGDGALVSAGNLNNHLGAPFSLLKMNEGHQVAVLEMGMNHAGELTSLARAARPQAALINNAQRAHLQGVGDLRAVAAAKGELVSALPLDGTAIINADDAFADFWRALAKPRRVLAFGAADNADCRIINKGDSLRLPDGVEIPLRLQVAGAHQKHNAAAAAAAAFTLGATADSIARGLEKFSGVSGRLQKKRGVGGALILDDSYNANPDSVRAALAVLRGYKPPRFVAMGDMFELGDSAAAAHEESLRAALATADEVFVVGEQMNAAARAAGDSASRCFAFENKESLADALRRRLQESGGGVVLVKGSRGMRMESVAAALEAE